jgi:hypothetical protein
MKTMNKGDIKASVILFTYLSVGITSGYYLEQYSQRKDGEGYIFGFVLGVLCLLLLQSIWGLIRLHVED